MSPYNSPDARNETGHAAAPLAHPCTYAEELDQCDGNCLAALIDSQCILRFCGA